MHTLREIMTTDVEYVTPQDNVFEAASKMRASNVGMVPVVENGVLKGVITDRDLVVRGIAGKQPNSGSVADIMSTSLVTGTPDMTVDEAARIMAEAQVRRLPVVENNRLVGVVSIGDMAVREQHQDEASQALNEISETHNPNASNDLKS
ncbi:MULTISPECIES: CBS domain-containing protein [Thermoactinomyces]|jgi:CBS domain-containing protein|uniref:CBS domain-containing protein n=1 Tax=Thermoactinomyces daqus TaxID=1329516 RepID=A0A7W1X802_9BACL|nr:MULTISPECIES: CBS domain-containing protein [Thermoactinomyces]MBA4541761.1 CBS domain-containing protein [Thermoactinomyces daqus]MBH8597153.1 CBS domain-containing protein [Thermoactinomyces sp. CICC 10523]MBH8602713.1 CBS domain-containing protein [Thermoactinomyces sp. CICC 10522]MBH8606176.1 CBS domain-containing protein [Thermoactinomyces sp. CICC 10521]